MADYGAVGNALGKPINFQIVLLLAVVGMLLIILLILWWYFSHNIRVTILRFTGNKGRPMIVWKKAKKTTFKGVTRLKIMGYKMPIRDFRQDNYYPSFKGKFGALLLWEFEDGYLTPVLPKHRLNGLSKDEKLQSIIDALHEYAPINFEYDPKIHADLVLKAVEDVDVDFMIQEYARINEQYAGGWGEFLSKFGGHIIVAFIAIIMLVMVIIFFNKAPELATACANAAVETNKNMFYELARGIANNTAIPAG